MIETVSHTKKVKTRKPHYCFACGRLHPPKSDMFRQANVYDGEIGSVYHCEPCNIIMSEFEELCIDGWEFPEGCVKNIPVNSFTNLELEEYCIEPSPRTILDILRRTKPEES